MDGHAIIYGDTTGELFRARSVFGRTHRVDSPKGSSDIFVITLEKSDGSYASTVETIKFELWMGLLTIALFLSLCYAWRWFGCSCCRRRKKTGAGQSQYFPKDESDTFHDEEETLVSSREVELVSSSRGKANVASPLQRNTNNRLDDFMPQYYNGNTGVPRPGRNVV
jgi:hypothetical protein